MNSCHTWKLCCSPLKIFVELEDSQNKLLNFSPIVSYLLSICKTHPIFIMNRKELVAAMMTFHWIKEEFWILIPRFNYCSQDFCLRKLSSISASLTLSFTIIGSAIWISKSKGFVFIKFAFVQDNEKLNVLSDHSNLLIFQHPINIENKIRECRNQPPTQDYLKLPRRKEHEFFILLEPPSPFFFLSSRESLALFASWLAMIEKKGNWLEGLVAVRDLEQSPS